MQSTIKFKGWLLAAITLLVFILQFTAPSRVWNIVFLSLGLTLLIAFMWAKGLNANITFSRERRYTWAQVGDRLEERLTLDNSGTFPALWAEIIDRSTLPGYTISRVTGVGSKTTSKWHTKGVCTQRGIFQLGPTTITTGDPFGLFELHKNYPNTVDFTITPPILSLPELEIDTRGQSGDTTVRRYSLSHTQSAASVRAYQAGDSLKHIHWPTTARRNDFFVREWQAVSSGDWWLALDLDKATHQGENQNSTLEKAVLIATAIAGAGLAQKHAVGLLAQGEESVWLPPQADELQRWEILKILAQVSAGDLSLEQLLTRNRHSIARNANLVIISASTSLDWLNPLLLIRRQGVSPTVILIFTQDTQTQLEASYQVLISQGIKTHLVHRRAIDIPTPDKVAGNWEWYVTGTGKAIPVQKPQGSWEQV